MTDNKSQDIRVIYLGRTVTNKDVLGHKFIPFDMLDKHLKIEADRSNFTSCVSVFGLGKSKRKLVIGGVYKCTGEIDSYNGTIESLNWGSHIFDHKLDIENIEQWFLTDQAAEHEVAMITQEKKLIRNAGAIIEIETLAEILSRTRGYQQQAMQAAIGKLISEKATQIKIARARAARS